MCGPYDSHPDGWLIAVCSRACERFGWPWQRVWEEIPLSVINMLVRQAGDDRKRSGFGTADDEYLETIVKPWFSKNGS